jgi:PAS domain S-box-containing protein
MHITYGRDDDPELSLSSLRVITIVLPILFLCCVGALTAVALRPWIASQPLRLLVIFGILLAGIIPFSVWVFRFIERQQRSLVRAATLLESVSDYAIVMLDTSGRVLTWNRAAERVSGHSTNEIVGQSYSRFYTPEAIARGEPRRNLNQAEARGGVENEGWRIKSDGTRFWANVVMTSVRDTDGRLTGFSTVTRDMTERKQSQERIEELNSELQSRVAELAWANEQIARRHQELEAVNEAIAAISSALQPQEVLQRIVNAARELVSAQYAALGVTADDGHLVEFITSGMSENDRVAIGAIPRGDGILGLLIRERRPMRIDDISAQPRSVGFPPNHPHMTSFLGVPILFHGEPVGNLYLTDKLDGQAFTAGDENLLVLLANHAAVAINNSRLYAASQASADQLQQWNEELEAKVANRTRQVEQYSKDMTLRILAAQEEERRRIARELHDETAQSLSTLLINLDLLELQLPQNDLQLQVGFDRLRGLAKRTLDETRALSHDLRPTILDDVGLVAAIHWYADEFMKTFAVRVDVDAEAPSEKRLPPQIEVALFRIAQEALTNIGKYAGAKSVFVGLTFPDSSAELVVRDDGVGFDLDNVPGPTREGGLGLYGMRERAELLGGSLTIDTAPGRGTTITVVAPTETQSNIRIDDPVDTPGMR